MSQRSSPQKCFGNLLNRHITFAKQTEQLSDGIVLGQLDLSWRQNVFGQIARVLRQRICIWNANQLGSDPRKGGTPPSLSPRYFVLPRLGILFHCHLYRV